MMNATTAIEIARKLSKDFHRRGVFADVEVKAVKGRPVVIARGWVGRTHSGLRHPFVVPGCIEDDNGNLLSPHIVTPPHRRVA